jgi:hypothetical protein
VETRLAETLAAGVPVGSLTDEPGPSPRKRLSADEIVQRLQCDSLEAPHGVLVRDLEGEPGPGAHLIGDLLAVRFPGDDTDRRWAITDESEMYEGLGYRWRPWDKIREHHADKPMRRLLPRTAGQRLGADSDEAVAMRAAEPLTLDAIKDAMRDVLLQFEADGEGDFIALEFHDEEVRQLTAERDEARRERDVAKLQLAGTLAGLGRLLDFHGGDENGGLRHPAATQDDQQDAGGA